MCCRGAAALEADTVTAPVRPTEHCRSQSQHRQEKAVGKLGSSSGWRLHQDAQKHQKIASWLACAAYMYNCYRYYKLSSLVLLVHV